MLHLPPETAGEAAAKSYHRVIPAFLAVAKCTAWPIINVCWTMHVPVPHGNSLSQHVRVQRKVCDRLDLRVPACVTQYNVLFPRRSTAGDASPRRWLLPQSPRPECTGCTRILSRKEVCLSQRAVLSTEGRDVTVQTPRFCAVTCCTGGILVNHRASSSSLRCAQICQEGCPS
jgi:hypothetical protein